MSLTLCLSLSCAYASFSVSLGLPISLSLPLCSLPVPTFCLPMSPHVPSSPSLSLFLPSTANLETCLHLSCVFFSLSLSISDLCLGLLCVPPSQGISLPSPCASWQPAPTSGLGIITQRPCPIQRRPLCSLSHPPGLAFSSSFPGPKARQGSPAQNVEKCGPVSGAQAPGGPRWVSELDHPHTTPGAIGETTPTTTFPIPQSLTPAAHSSTGQPAARVRSSSRPWEA